MWSPMKSTLKQNFKKIYLPGEELVQYSDQFLGSALVRESCKPAYVGEQDTEKEKRRGFILRKRLLNILLLYGTLRRRRFGR